MNKGTYSMDWWNVCVVRTKCNCQIHSFMKICIINDLYPFVLSYANLVVYTMATQSISQRQRPRQWSISENIHLPTGLLVKFSAEASTTLSRGLFSLTDQQIVMSYQYLSFMPVCIFLDLYDIHIHMCNYFSFFEVK